MREHGQADADAHPLGPVLVIDGIAPIRDLAKRVLKSASYPVLLAATALEGLTQARQNQPVLVLLATDLPDLPLVDVCERLGAEPGLENVPIVVMGKRGAPQRDRFVPELGIADFIAKPFAPEALLAVVRHTLKRSAWATTRWRNPDARRTNEPVEGLRQDLRSLLERHFGSRAVSTKRFEAMVKDPDFTALVHRLERILDTAPALAGALEQIPIAEILQMLSLQRQRGFLRVRHRASRVSVAFDDGHVCLVTAENLPDEFRLGNILVRQGALNRDTLDQLLKQHTNLLLGHQVLQQGHVTQAEVHAALRHQSAELVYEMLRWSHGRFWFERRTTLPDEVREFEFGLGIDALLMEGYRRVDEWGLLEEAIPSFDCVLVEVPGGAENAGPDGLTDEEQQIFALVDGRRTVHAIIEQAGRETFPVLRILYRLVSAHVVTLVKEQEEARP